jgi:hypothetical protein
MIVGTSGKIPIIALYDPPFNPWITLKTSSFWNIVVIGVMKPNVGVYELCQFPSFRYN